MSVVVAAALASAAPSSFAACRAESPAHTVALVELYTSQGCSSCPPADRWLSQISTRYPGEKVVPLALHVGYWDYIGWKDPYARPEFTERQKQLATLNGSRMVFTPGVFVQARNARDWRDGARFESGVSAINRRPATAKIEIEAVPGDALAVRLKTTASGGGRAFVALTQGGLVTAVKAGENRGDTLRNDHVVRAWSGPLPLGETTASLPVPPGAAWRDLALVAFVQDAADGEVRQALRMSLADCAAVPRS
jgi:hypothetical protein